MQLKSCRLAFCCFLNSLNFIPEFSSLCAVLAECRERSTEQWSDSCKNLALCKGKKFTACFSSTSGQRQRQSDPPKRSSQFTWRPALSCAPRIVCEGTATGQALSSVPFVPSPCQCRSAHHHHLVLPNARTEQQDNFTVALKSSSAFPLFTVGAVALPFVMNALQYFQSRQSATYVLTVHTLADADKVRKREQAGKDCVTTILLLLQKTRSQIFGLPREERFKAMWIWPTRARLLQHTCPK
jgi:hypothetical protein